MTAKPEHLGREASLTSTPALTIAGVTSEPLGSETSKSARTGMDLRTSQVYYKVSLDVHDLLKRAAGSERKSTLEPAGARRTFCGLRMTKPSLTNLRMFWREFAMLISLIYGVKGRWGGSARTHEPSERVRSENPSERWTSLGRAEQLPDIQSSFNKPCTHGACNHMTSIRSRKVSSRASLDPRRQAPSSIPREF